MTATQLSIRTEVLCSTLQNQSTRSRLALVGLAMVSGLVITANLKKKLRGGNSGRAGLRKLSQIKQDIDNEQSISRKTSTLMIMSPEGSPRIKRLNEKNYLEQDFTCLQALELEGMTILMFGIKASASLGWSYSDFCLGNPVLLDDFSTENERTTLAHLLFPLVEGSDDLAIPKKLFYPTLTGATESQDGTTQREVLALHDSIAGNFDFQWADARDGIYSWIAAASVVLPSAS